MDFELTDQHIYNPSETLKKLLYQMYQALLALAATAPPSFLAGKEEDEDASGPSLADLWRVLHLFVHVCRGGYVGGVRS